MPYYCCVRGCFSNTSGHTFLGNTAEKHKWRVAIRRADEKSKRLWEPSQNDRVCGDHFTLNDYVPTLLGRHIDDIIKLFNF